MASEAAAAMEIEGPDSPIRSLRDFAVHIATVTLGILIALGLEALIEARRDDALVDHTRRDFAIEFTHNRALVAHDLAASAETEAELAGLIAYGQARLARQPATFPKLQPGRSFAYATATAWETATATQALIHLPFAQTGLLSEAQARQKALNGLQDRAEAQWFELAGYGDPEHLPQSDVDVALQKVTIAYAYRRSVSEAERQLLPAYDRALRSLGR